MDKTDPPAPITVSVSLLSLIFLYLASLKVDVDEFLRSLGIEPESVKSPDTRIPIETYLLIQDEAAEYTHDPYFGLHMGEYAKAGSWSILGYMLMNCRTLGEAIEKSSRYSRIIGNLIEPATQPGPDKVKIVFSTPPYAPGMTRHCFEASLSSSVHLLRTVTGVRLCPQEVTFTHAEPESTAEHERIFGCSVHFGQKENSIIFDARIGNTPVLMANPELLDYFEKYAQDFLAGMERKNEYTRAVTKIVLARLDDETLGIEKVAREMSVSVRTLQNHLEAEGVIFSELLKDIRQRLAKKYLTENYSVEQITYLLGFSEPSAFRKAFKHWAGVTPREYRERPVSAINRI